MNPATLAAAAGIVLTHGHEASNVTGFPGPGSWLIFGIVLMPIYVMVAAWFIGRPREMTPQVLGVIYLVGIASVMWIGMLITTLLIGVVFF